MIFLKAEMFAFFFSRSLARLHRDRDKWREKERIEDTYKDRE
jgi:hypothetical protein